MSKPPAPAPNSAIASSKSASSVMRMAVKSGRISAIRSIPAADQPRRDRPDRHHADDVRRPADLQPATSGDDAAARRRGHPGPQRPLRSLLPHSRIPGRWTGSSAKPWQSPHVFDTVRIARRRFGRGGNGLAIPRRRLGYEPPIAHRALPDALTTAIVFDLLLAAVGGWNICLCDVLTEQGGPMALLPASTAKARSPWNWKRPSTSAGPF